MESIRDEQRAFWAEVIDPPPDYSWRRPSIDIETLLIWTYRTQRADVVLAGGGGLFDQEAAADGGFVPSARDSSVSLQRAGILGVRVDGGGPSCDALHIDAERVHEAVMRLDHPIALLVMRHARAGSRPDQIDFAPSKPVAVRDHQGRPKRGYADWDVSRRHGWCEIVYTASIGNVEIARAEYALWHAALRRLAGDLHRELYDHTVLPPEAPCAGR